MIAADACSDYGLEVAPLSKDTLDKVQELLPEYFVPGNPIDLVAGLDLSVIKPVLETVMRSGEVDSVIFIFIEAQRNKGPNIQEFGGQGVDMGAMWEIAMQQVRPRIKALHGLSQEIGVPLYIVANVQEGKSGDEETLLEDDSPMMHKEVESACVAISAMVEYYEYRQRALSG